VGRNFGELLLEFVMDLQLAVGVFKLFVGFDKRPVAALQVVRPFLDQPFEFPVG
jgi:hypothetical protein